MKVLITGNAGFIGYHLTSHDFFKEIQVVGLDNINDYYDTDLKFERLRLLGFDKHTVKENILLKSERFASHFFIKMDLCDAAGLQHLFSKENFDVVIHLAAQAGVRNSIKNPKDYIQSNINGFFNILDCCQKFKIKHLIYASSSSVYGNNNAIPFTENMQVDKPTSLYAATKKSNELMAYSYSSIHKLRTTGLRFFTVYGPLGRPDMAPMLFLKAIFEEKKLKIFNAGDLKRDFTFVDDIIEGIVGVIAVESSNDPPSDIFNLGNSAPIALLDFVQLLEKKANKRAQMEMLPMQPGDMNETYASTLKLKKSINYSPNTNLETGLEKFINWYKTYYKID